MPRRHTQHLPTTVQKTGGNRAQCSHFKGPMEVWEVGGAVSSATAQRGVNSHLVLALTSTLDGVSKRFQCFQNRFKGIQDPDHPSR